VRRVRFSLFIISFRRTGQNLAPPSSQGPDPQVGATTSTVKLRLNGCQVRLSISVRLIRPQLFPNINLERSPIKRLAEHSIGVQQSQLCQAQGLVRRSAFRNLAIHLIHQLRCRNVAHLP